MIVILVTGLLLSGCWWTKEIVRPVWTIPERPKIEVGNKQRADTFVGYVDETELKNYVILHKNELKKDIITRERLKGHIEKLENIIKGCCGGDGVK
jgi:hypothetical protein